MPDNQTDGFRKGVAMDVAMWAAQHDTAPSLSFVLRRLLIKPGFHFVFWHRVARLIRRVPLVGKAAARFLVFGLELTYSSEIALNAELGGGLFTPHPFGIVIGMSSEIGRNVTLLQNVTLGNRTPDNPAKPKILDGAYLGAGAVLLGPITVGRNAKIGANAVVLIDVPDGTAAIGNPARVLLPRQ